MGLSPNALLNPGPAPQRSAPALLNPGPAPSHYVPPAPQRSATALLNPAHVYQPPAHYSAPAAPQRSATSLLNPGPGGHSAPAAAHASAPNVARLAAVLAQLNSTKSGQQMISQMLRWVPGFGTNPFTHEPNHDFLNPYKDSAPLDYGHSLIPSDPFGMPKGLATVEGQLPQYDKVPQGGVGNPGGTVVPNAHLSGPPKFFYPYKAGKGYVPRYPIEPHWADPPQRV